MKLPSWVKRTLQPPAAVKVTRPVPASRAQSPAAVMVTGSPELAVAVGR